MLRKISFIVVILGLAFLFYLLMMSPKEINSLDELDSLEINEKVIFKGIVDSQRDFGDFRILVVDGIKVVCNCVDSYIGREVEVEGFIDEFNDKKQVRASRINIFD